MPDSAAIEARLLEAITAAPRPYLLPPLPADAQAAAAAGTEAALAFCIEDARRSAVLPPQAETQHDATRHLASQDLFTRALAALIRSALDPATGDAHFQATVLRARDPVVQEFAGLAAREDADARRVRKAVDAIAHPGKRTVAPPGENACLYALSRSGDWAGLAGAIADPALLRLQRLQSLRAHASVQEYLALCARRGPAAGSEDAAAQGRASARVGERAEQETVQAFATLARLLDARCGAGSYRVAHGLRTPAGFPGEPGQAKDEWDVALLQSEGDACRLVLLAEVKAAAAAAAADFTRLQRGLQRLARADPTTVYAFPTNDGVAHLAGESLRVLAPPAGGLPPQVFYCCAAPEDRPALLGAATKGVLLAEAASIAFAQDPQASPEVLAPIWQALPTAPRLRSVLHQDASARAARAAMLRPADLVLAAAAALRD